MSPVLLRSELLRDGAIDRLDAEFFDEERIATETRLRRQAGLALGEHFDISEARAADPRKNATPGETITYVEIGNIDTRDGFVLCEPTLAEEAPSRARVLLRVGMVGMSTVRPVRSQVFFVTQDLDRAIGTTGFIMLTDRGKGQITPDVLFPALKTRHVIDQLDRRARASMYPTLSPRDVSDVVLPRLPKRVVSSVQQSITAARAERAEFLKRQVVLRAIANRYFGAMDPELLIANLGDGRATTRKRNDLIEKDDLGRIDAEFHAAAFDDAIKRMQRAGPVEPLGKLASWISTGSSPAEAEYSDCDEETQSAVIKVGALTGAGINWPAMAFAPKKYADAEENRVQDGDILFTSTAHQPKYMAHKIDVVRAIPTELRDRITFVGELMGLRINDPKRMPPDYVAAFLRNPLGKEQIRRCIRGISSHVYPEDVREIVVPIPDEKTAKAIAKAAREVEEARWAYGRLVRQAIEAIEIHVESVL
ncbi:MAG TPA: hypothetical protein VG053_01870 [Solirubrobacteraceae bacterium]|nr:hypothetical protein [Solirubrobacteraceae bacterium]